MALFGSLQLPLYLTPSGSLRLLLALIGSLWLPLWLPLALTATLWLTLALSGSLLLSNFAYTVLDRLSGPLLGYQRRCHADALCPGLVSNKMSPPAMQWVSDKILHTYPACRPCQIQVPHTFTISNKQRLFPLHVQTRRPFTGIIGVRLLRNAFFFKLNFPKVGFCSNTLLFFLLQSCALSIPGAGWCCCAQ